MISKFSSKPDCDIQNVVTPDVLDAFDQNSSLNTWMSYLACTQNVFVICLVPVVEASRTVVVKVELTKLCIAILCICLHFLSSTASCSTRVGFDIRRVESGLTKSVRQTASQTRPRQPPQSRHSQTPPIPLRHQQPRVARYIDHLIQRPQARRRSPDHDVHRTCQAPTRLKGPAAPIARS
jgi:hypothetical protein